MAQKRFDAAEYLDSPEAIADYLSEAFETGDVEFIAQAIGTISRRDQLSARFAGRKAPAGFIDDAPVVFDE